MLSMDAMNRDCDAEKTAEKIAELAAGIVGRRDTANATAMMEHTLEGSRDSHSANSVLVPEELDSRRLTSEMAPSLCFTSSDSSSAHLIPNALEFGFNLINQALETVDIVSPTPLNSAST
ncbi:hypothetical protein V502_10121, partial [Pseudogymnoascus sp. VKM F-4520 (FW-2644)]